MDNFSIKKMDPRTKLLICILLIAAIFAAGRQITILSQTALILIFIFSMGETRPFIRSLKLSGPMVALVFLISCLSFGLSEAAIIAVRLFNIFTASILVFKHLRPEELAGALRKMKVPFGFVFILTTGIRFVPLMRKKIGGIRDAQMARGIDLSFKLKNAKNFQAMLAPLLTQSLLLSDELAVAMEVRGFSRNNRSSLREYKFEKKDYFISVAAISAFAAFICWELGS